MSVPLHSTNSAANRGANSDRTYIAYSSKMNDDEDLSSVLQLMQNSTIRRITGMIVAFLITWMTFEIITSPSATTQTSLETNENELQRHERRYERGVR